MYVSQSTTTQNNRGEMKAKQIVYEGIHFRSKLEARYYIFFKSLGFDVEYEPEVQNVYGYQPDFVIYSEREEDDYLGKNKHIYKEIKPIRDITKLFDDENYDEFIEKINKCWNRKEDLILFGGNTFSKRGHWCATALCWQENFAKFGGSSYGINYCYHRIDTNKISLSYHFHEILGLIKQDEAYPVWSDYSGYEKETTKFINTKWNEAWSILRWKGKEVA
jgi:hypothetical protein